MKKTSRRQFIANAAVTTGAALAARSIPTWAKSADASRAGRDYRHSFRRSDIRRCSCWIARFAVNSNRITTSTSISTKTRC